METDRQTGRDLQRQADVELRREAAVAQHLAIWNIFALIAYSRADLYIAIFSAGCQTLKTSDRHLQVLFSYVYLSLAYVTVEL